jgi:hypothetical protein
MELWKWVPEFEGRYEVSSEGQIRSHLHGKLRYLKLCADPRGYIPVNLSEPDGKRKRYWLHRLVAIVFIPNPQNRKEVNHKNGVKSDCRVANLEWVSRSQNIRHAYEQGLITTIGQRGARNFNTKLTDAKVLEMRRLYAEREMTQEEIGKLFGVTKLTAYRILNRLSWTHI